MIFYSYREILYWIGACVVRNLDYILTEKFKIMIPHQLYTFLTLFGGALGIVLATGEIVRKNRAALHYILFGFLFCTGMWQLYAGLLFSGLLTGGAVHLRMWHLPFAYGVGPFLWFYLRPLLSADAGVPGLAWRDLRHFAIIPVCVALLLPVFLADASYKTALTDFSQDLSKGMVTGRAASLYEHLAALALYGPKISVLLYCLIWMWRVGRRRESLASGLPLRILFALAAGIAASAGFALVDHFVPGMAWHQAAASGASLCIYALYILDRRFAIYRTVESSGGRGADARYERSRLNGLPIENIKSRIEHLLVAENLYADEDLSLARLAAALSYDSPVVQPHQLSELINRGFGCNFNQLVNRYRVQAARRLLESEPERSILSIAMASGFNSKSVFHRAFKQEFDITPGEYRRRL